MIKNIKKKFNPLLFLSSLGAGGIAVSGFIVLQYCGFFHGKGLATFSDIPQTPLAIFLEGIMVVFGIIHAYLTVVYFIGLGSWKKTDAYKKFIENPLVNSGIMAPYVSVAMSMNVIIAVVRYFSETLSSNFQAIMLPAFIFFVYLWSATVFRVMSLLKIAFTRSFDVDKIHFGWLLQPFAVAMITVTGSGFAALAKDHIIAGAAAFMVLVSTSMVIFLTAVKMFAVFKRHLQRDSEFEDQFMPTYLIVVPIVTLLGITVFRMGHYGQHLFHNDVVFLFAKIIMIALYAFQVWYFVFGLMMLNRYWSDYFGKKFHVSQWGLVCPFVALGALSGFVYKAFFPNQFYLTFILANLTGVSLLFFYLLSRQFKCISNDENSICDK